jgi:hypothetical protein
MNASSRSGHARWWLRLTLAGTLAIGAFALQSVPAQAAPVGSDTVLAGVTSQGYPSWLRIAPNGKTVEVGQIALTMGCASGAELTVPDFFANVRIHANGRMHVAVNIPSTALSGGGSYAGTDSVTGKLNRKRSQVTGVWQLHVFYTFPDGTSDQCESGPVRFTDVD